MNVLKKLRFLVLALALISSVVLADGKSLLDLDYRPLAGRDSINLQRRYSGKVLLVVNTASKCGFTPQYEGLEALHQRFSPLGFAVLGFPSNDFKGQEPGDEQQIQKFCTLTYGVKFPMFQKVHVTGDEVTPLYQRLTEMTGVAPGWNFHKYLIARDGQVVAQFDSRTRPDDPILLEAIKRELAKPVPVAH
ncbi:glutathione peroxidase [Xylella taiwanensis]|uniref:Glutathione peroxidase n=1 Tax=Xylella taiwanensis TaxID=1444770 RepID=Z9JFR9_9GAMM|nr:glutathione peroxidase [Xylella taiwanensis]AXI83818.1 vitamin B12 ABC transporter permease [Xylella taiwanensis]EWS77255.1 vitamin B12 ABC transporter permease [Xylella taiwanensis]MCD8456919.1 glutathione peroxidase [Xylella taiwanensis]MCD8459331.1 glutathione peroxidase [Xylella taiwanensis]MCD8461798.1 glutathione peroxidase [Xylella taiwanensis]